MGASTAGGGPGTRWGGDRRRKLFAIGTAGTVLGLGAATTLAAWTDTEWVFGGNGTDGPGISTSTFEVQQNATVAVDPGAWTDEETNPGGSLTFSLGATALSPGDATYAPVALRTASDSIAGTVTLQPAVAAGGITVVDPEGLLFAALTVRVATDSDPLTCDATAFDGSQTGVTVIADGPLATEGGSASQSLAAASGSVQYYCFELALPDPLTPEVGFTLDDYMGLSAAPAWQFAGQST